MLAIIVFVFVATFLYECTLAVGQFNALILTQHPNSTNVTLHHQGDSAFLSFILHNRYNQMSIRRIITKHFMNGSEATTGLGHFSSPENGVPRLNEAETEGIVYVHWPTPTGSGPIRDEYVIRVLHGSQMDNVRMLNIEMEIKAEANPTSTAVTFNVIFATSATLPASESPIIKPTITVSSEEDTVTNSIQPTLTDDPLPTTRDPYLNPSPAPCDCTHCTFPSSPVSSNSRSIIAGVSSTTVLIVVGMAVIVILGLTILKCNYGKKNKIHPN